MLAAPRLTRSRLADYEQYADQDLVEEIASLGRRLAGLRVLHLSSSDGATDPVPSALPSIVRFERELGLESEWLVPRPDAGMRGASRASRWWPDPSESEWSDWISSNYRAARDIEGTWDVVMVHGASLAGVAGIARDKAGVWLWQQQPCRAAEPSSHRAADYLAYYSGTLGPDHGAGATVDPVAPFNLRLAPAVARRVGRLHALDTDRPFLFHIARFAPWVGLDEVIAAYWEAKSAVAELQLVIGGPAGSGRPPRHNGVVARSSEDPDLRTLANLSSVEIAALRSCASINLRGPAATGYTLDVRESHWIGRRVLAWPQHGRLSARATGLRIAETPMVDDAPLPDSPGHAAVRSNHLIVHGLRDWLRKLDSLAITSHGSSPNSPDGGG